MAEKIQKCPMCGTKLKMINGKMTCKDCGYYLRDANETVTSSGSSQSGSYGSTGGTQSSSYGSSGSSQPGPYSSTNSSQSGSYNYPGTNVQVGPYKAPENTAAPSKKSSGSKTGIRAVLISVASALCIGLSSGYVRNGIKDIIKTLSTKEDDPFPYDISYPSISMPNWGGTSGSTASGSTTTASVVLPTSDFAIDFVEAVYDKDYKSVTAEEYGAVTALKADGKDNYVYYQLNDGDTHYLYYPDGYSLKVSDLKCFPNLGQLYIDNKMLMSGDLKGLENLYVIHSRNSAKELARIVPHPENILDLGIYDLGFNTDLNDLSNFPNLLYLTVDSSHLADISQLKSFPDLLGLDLGKCNDVTDYSPLMSLAQLEELSISSSQLKTIDFIKQMPNLMYLHVEDSQIQDLSALSSCPMLTNLLLEGNNKLDDYTPIGNLSNLAYLTLEVHQQTRQPLPSFENLTGVIYLSLDNINDLSPLRDAVNVEALILEHCDSRHLDVLTAMPYLSYLKIDDFWGLTESLAPLTHLSSLEELDISGTNIYGNIEEIFSIPTLKYLYMDDCQVGIDFDAVAPNPNLEVLSMCDVRILKDPSYNNGNKIYLSEHYEFFDNFPNLTELYVSSANLGNIDFVTKMPGLRYLDISNNNITSLAPLLQLDDFYTVWCGKNTILENIPEDSGIWVYTTSRD